MRILAFGTYDVRTHPRVGVLVQGLRDSGHDVLEVNRSLGLDTAQRIAMVRQPWRLPLLAARLVRCWVALSWRARRERRRFDPDVVLIGYLGHFDVHLARLLFGRTPLVLDHLASAAGTVSDRRLATSRGVRARLMSAIDAAALGAADVIVLDTSERIGTLPEGARAKVAVCPVGATDAWFTAGRSALDRPQRLGLSVVFVGLYTPLHGAPVIAEAVAELADDERITVTMVGDGQDRAAAERIAAANPRVTWIDWVDSDDLPGLVASHDVSLGIVGTTQKAREVVPTKAYQGAAAATLVVTSDTAPQRAALAGAAVFVPPGDAPALARMLRHLADDPDEVARLRSSAYAVAGARFTARASVRPLVDALASRGIDREAASLNADVEEGPVTEADAKATDPLPPLAIRAWLRYDVVKGVIDRLRPRTALEIGCGQGAFGARLAERADYLGVEPDDTSFAVATRRIAPRGGKVLHGIHTVVPDGSTFDLVCAFEVLEHIEDDAATLAEWTRFVRPGGHLVLSVPAFQDRFGPMDVHAGHFRRYSPDELRAVLADAGLADIEVTVYGWPLGYALEAVRNRIDARKLRRVGDASMAELTQASGRTFQPTTPRQGAFVAVSTAPFRVLQRLRPGAGTGLVAVARRPG